VAIRQALTSDDPSPLVSCESTSARGGFARLARIRPTVPQQPTIGFAAAARVHANCGYSCWAAITALLGKRAVTAIVSAVWLAVACANDPESLGQPTSAGPQAIATNLDVPWGIAFLPDGSALIAERDSGAIQHMPQPGVVGDDRILQFRP
jgi:hypothetical protein